MKKRQNKAHVSLSIEAQKVLFLDVCTRRQIEACGVLLGSMDSEGNWHVEKAYPLRNTSNSPVYFEFAPEDLLEIDLTYPGQVVGVYHSHPTGFASASSTDRGNMQRVNQEQNIPWVWLIVCGPFDDAFIRQTQRLIPEASIIAYHHYTQKGLQQVAIQLEQPIEKEAI